MRVAASVELRSSLLQLSVNPFLVAVLEGVVAAFEARALVLYAPQTTFEKSPF